MLGVVFFALLSSSTVFATDIPVFRALSVPTTPAAYEPCGNYTVCCVMYGASVIMGVGTDDLNVTLPYFQCKGNVSVVLQSVEVSSSFWYGPATPSMTVKPSVSYPGYTVFSFFGILRGYENLYSNSGQYLNGVFLLTYRNQSSTSQFQFGLMCAWTPPDPSTYSVLQFTDNVGNQLQPNAIIPIAYDNVMDVLANFTTQIQMTGANFDDPVLYQPTVVFLGWTTTNTTYFNVNLLVWQTANALPPWIRFNDSRQLTSGSAILEFLFTPLETTPWEYFMFQVQLQDNLNYYDPVFFVVQPVTVLPPPANNDSSSTNWVVPVAVVLGLLGLVGLIAAVCWFHKRRNSGESHYLLDNSTSETAGRSG